MTSAPDDSRSLATKARFPSAALIALLYSFLPLGLMILCVVHAIRNGNVWPWIYVIVLLPGIGSLI
jgi:hypothetical protein